jgi:hypothetical protein
MLPAVPMGAGQVRRAIEIAYVVLAATPTVGVVALQWLTPGSLVSGLAVGAAVPALAAVGVALMGVGSLLVLRARRQRHRARLLSLGIGLAGVMPLLLGLTWLFG